MSNLSDERLSSLLDGELDDTQQRHAVDALGGDVEARERWERFHLAGDALHGDLAEAIDPRFAARVMAAIDDEPAILAPSLPRQSSTSSTRTHAPSRLSKRFAGLAVAASVAAVAVMGVESLYHEDPAAPFNQQVAENNAPPSDYIRLAKQPSLPAAASLASVVNAPLMISPLVVPSPLAVPSQTARAEMLRAHPDIVRRIDPRLHKYLINHSQQAARSNIQGVMPYARIVTYPGVQQRSVQR
ncbi:hypothetical protein MNBD_GAMMA20-1829 [hydrothermal vent metagenome]|uniref:Anti sigma-E protein RseA N-terminal domain-containing protein n=1 Tax=hydrothermal vent metagenome TaxID=652676 RepID=A0A3B1AJH7_9ZZZZ